MSAQVSRSRGFRNTDRFIRSLPLLLGYKRIRTIEQVKVHRSSQCALDSCVRPSRSRNGTRRAWRPLVFPHRSRPLTLAHPADVIRAVCFVGRTYFRISASAEYRSASSSFASARASASCSFASASSSLASAHVSASSSSRLHEPPLFRIVRPQKGTWFETMTGRSVPRHRGDADDPPVADKPHH